MNKLLKFGIANVFLVAGQLELAMAQSNNPPNGSPVSAADEAAIHAIVDCQTDAGFLLRSQYSAESAIQLIEDQRSATTVTAISAVPAHPKKVSVGRALKRPIT